MQEPRADRPGAGQMLAEVIDLSAGVGVMLLPLLPLAIPGVLLVVVPVVLLAAVAAVPAVIATAILVPPFLLARLVRRRLASR
jgi:hypothetical protein